MPNVCDMPVEVARSSPVIFLDRCPAVHRDDPERSVSAVSPLFATIRNWVTVQGADAVRAVTERLDVGDELAVAVSTAEMKRSLFNGGG
jgi:hypothetical protein